MIDRLLDVLVKVFESFVPFVILFDYERGLLMRLGKFKRELPPGFHWVLPFQLDTVLHENVCARTERLAGMSTTTSDGKSVGFDAVITYRIDNLRKAMLEVDDLKDAIADTCAGQIGTALSGVEWSQLVKGNAVDELTLVCRKRGWRWGIEILSVQLAGIALVKNIRLSHSGVQPHQLPGGHP